MKKTYVLFLLLASLLLALGCNKSNEELEINDFKGLYRITSILSSKAIDLNNDNNKSNNYLQEIKSDFITFNGQIINCNYDNNVKNNFAEARPATAIQNNTKFLDLRFPIQRIDSLYQGNNDYEIINMDYKKITTGFIYKLLGNNVEIESDPFDDFTFYKIKNFYINRLNKNEFETKFDFNVYDFMDKKWVETNLKVQYVKQ